MAKAVLTADDWFENKVKFPRDWQTDSNGDLLKSQGSTSGVVVKSANQRIEIARQVPASTAVVLDFFIEKKKELPAPEEIFSKQRRELHELVRQYRMTGSTVTAHQIVEKNKEVRIAELNVLDIHKGRRHVEQLDEIKESDLSFNWYDRDPVKFPVTALTDSVFPALEFWESERLQPQNEVNDEEENEENNGQNGGGKPKREYTDKQRAIIANIMKKRAYSKA